MYLSRWSRLCGRRAIAEQEPGGIDQLQHRCDILKHNYGPNREPQETGEQETRKRDTLQSSTPWFFFSDWSNVKEEQRYVYQVISDFIKLSGRGGYAGKEVMKSNLCTAIFHKESVVCTLKCHRSSLFIGHFHFCSVFEGATVFRQRRVHSYCLGQVSKTPAEKSTPEECTIHKTGVKFF